MVPRNEYTTLRERVEDLGQRLSNAGANGRAEAYAVATMGARTFQRLFRALQYAVEAVRPYRAAAEACARFDEFRADLVARCGEIITGTSVLDDSPYEVHFQPALFASFSQQVEQLPELTR